MNRRKNFIIGGLGFIGHNLVDRLLLSNEIVHVIDVNNHSQNWHLLDPYSSSEFFSFELFDCTDVNTLFNSIKSFIPDRVFHFAANSDISKSDQVKYDFSNTLVTTLSLCEAIRLGAQIPNLVFASSSSIYGRFEGPMAVHTKSVCEPVNSYGWAKRASELALTAALSNSKCKLSIARFPNVVGPYLTHGLLYDIIQKKNDRNQIIQILGDGTQKKPYIHVNDLLDILIYKSDIENKKETIYNISVIDQITVKEIISIFKQVLSDDSIFLFEKQREGWSGDVAEYSFDTEESRVSGSLAITTSSQAISRAIKENIEIRT